MSLPESNAREDAASRDGFFPHDRGELPLETRRVLVQLLAGPSLDGRRHAQLWPVLIRDQAVIRRYLSELFLDLVLEPEVQIAFTRQAETGELEAPVLLRRAPLTFIDSVLLLHLRLRLMQAEGRGERAVVSLPEIREHLMLYERSANTDHAGFIKRINASIEKVKKHSILQSIRASGERLEISPTLKLLFSAEEVEALTRLYRGLLQDSNAAGDEQIKAESESHDVEGQ